MNNGGGTPTGQRKYRCVDDIMKSERNRTGFKCSDDWPCRVDAPWCVGVFVLTIAMGEGVGRFFTFLVHCLNAMDVINESEMRK